MLYKSTFINALDFFSKRDYNNHKEIKDNVTSYYESLKNIFESNQNNERVQNFVVNAFFSKIKTLDVNIGELISEVDVVKMLSEYETFSKSFDTKYKDKVDSIVENFCSIGNFKSIQNGSEMASYVMIEALMEENLMDKVFVPRNVESNEHSMYLSEDILSAKKDAEIFEQLKDKPFGYYIFHFRYKRMVSTSQNLSDIVIVSHQEYGLTTYKPHSKVSGSTGVSHYFISLKTMLNKEHPQPISESIGEEVAQYKENMSGFERLNIVNKLVIKTFISLVSSKEHIETLKNNYSGSLFLTKEKEHIETLKNTLPIVSELKNESFSGFTFDELRFKGKYAFMSVLDDLFEEYYNMEHVNLLSDEEDSFHMIKEYTEEGRSCSKIMTEFTKEAIDNQYYIHKFKYEKLGVNMDNRLSFLTPVTEVLIGEKEKVLEQTKQKALMNKLTFLNFLIEKYYYFYSDIFNKEIKECLLENKDAIIEDVDFLKMIKTIGACKNIRSNYYIINNHTNSILMSEQKNHFSFEEDEKIKDHKNKLSAQYLVAMPLYNYRIIELLTERYNLKLSKTSNNLFNIIKCQQTIFEMYSEIKRENPKQTRLNFFSFIDNGIDLELNKWFENGYFHYIIIPMNNKQYQSFEELIVTINECNIIQDCNKRNMGRLNFRDTDILQNLYQYK